MRVSATQALTDLAQQDGTLRTQALRRVRAALASRTPAEKARGRTLIQQSEEQHVEGRRKAIEVEQGSNRARNACFWQYSQRASR